MLRDQTPVKEKGVLVSLIVIPSKRSSSDIIFAPCARLIDHLAYVFRARIKIGETDSIFAMSRDFCGMDEAPSSKITEVRESTLLEEPRLQAGWRPARGQTVEVPGLLKYRD